MKYSDVYGLAAPEYGWVPAPSYILRRAAILEILKSLPPGKVLEIGCGSGALLYDLSQRGFYGVGVDISEKARNIAINILRKKNVSSFKIERTLEYLPKKSFDYLMAFEVLEHIEKDQEVLYEWNTYLKKGGYLLISVPAHMKKWTNTDDWAGHFRRYEREEIIAKTEKAGFNIKSLKSLGYPLSNILLPIRSYFHGRAIKKSKLTKKERTAMSGVDRTYDIIFFNFYSNIVGEIFFKFFIKLQSLFYYSDKGVGYLILAQKK